MDEETKEYFDKKFADLRSEMNYRFDKTRKAIEDMELKMLDEIREIKELEKA